MESPVTTETTNNQYFAQGSNEYLTNYSQQDPYSQAFQTSNITTQNTAQDFTTNFNQQYNLSSYQQTATSNNQVGSGTSSNGLENQNLDIEKLLSNIPGASNVETQQNFISGGQTTGQSNKPLTITTLILKSIQIPEQALKNVPEDVIKNIQDTAKNSISNQNSQSYQISNQTYNDFQTSNQNLLPVKNQTSDNLQLASANIDYSKQSNAQILSQTTTPAITEFPQTSFPINTEKVTTQAENFSNINYSAPSQQPFQENVVNNQAYLEQFNVPNTVTQSPVVNFDTGVATTTTPAEFPVTTQNVEKSSSYQTNPFPVTTPIVTSPQTVQKTSSYTDSYPISSTPVIPDIPVSAAVNEPVKYPTETTTQPAISETFPVSNTQDFSQFAFPSNATSTTPGITSTPPTNVAKQPEYIPNETTFTTPPATTQVVNQTDYIPRVPAFIPPQTNVVNQPDYFTSEPSVITQPPITTQAANNQFNLAEYFPTETQTVSSPQTNVVKQPDYFSSEASFPTVTTQEANQVNQTDYIPRVPAFIPPQTNEVNQAEYFTSEPSVVSQPPITTQAANNQFNLAEYFPTETPAVSSPQTNVTKQPDYFSNANDATFVTQPPITTQVTNQVTPTEYFPEEPFISPPVTNVVNQAEYIQSEPPVVSPPPVQVNTQPEYILDEPPYVPSQNKVYNQTDYTDYIPSEPTFVNPPREQVINQSNFNVTDFSSPTQVDNQPEYILDELYETPQTKVYNQNNYTDYTPSEPVFVNPPSKQLVNNFRYNQKTAPQPKRYVDQTDYFQTEPSYELPPTNVFNQTDYFQTEPSYELPPSTNDYIPNEPLLVNPPRKQIVNQPKFIPSERPFVSPPTRKSYFPEEPFISPPVNQTNFIPSEKPYVSPSNTNLYNERKFLPPPLQRTQHKAPIQTIITRPSPIIPSPRVIPRQKIIKNTAVLSPKTVIVSQKPILTQPPMITPRASVVQRKLITQTPTVVTASKPIVLQRKPVVAKVVPVKRQIPVIQTRLHTVKPEKIVPRPPQPQIVSVRPPIVAKPQVVTVHKTILPLRKSISTATLRRTSMPTTQTFARIPRTMTTTRIVPVARPSAILPTNTVVQSVMLPPPTATITNQIRPVTTMRASMPVTSIRRAYSIGTVYPKTRGYGVNTLMTRRNGRNNNYGNMLFSGRTYRAPLSRRY